MCIVNLDGDKVDIVQRELLDQFYKEINIFKEEINFTSDDNFDMLIASEIRELREFFILSEYKGNLYSFKRLFLDKIDTIFSNFYEKINYKNNKEIKKLEKNKELIFDILNIL